MVMTDVEVVVLQIVAPQVHLALEDNVVLVTGYALDGHHAEDFLVLVMNQVHKPALAGGQMMMDVVWLIPAPTPDHAPELQKMMYVIQVISVQEHLNVVDALSRMSV